MRSCLPGRQCLYFRNLEISRIGELLDKLEAYLEILCSDSGHVRDTQNKADGIQYVGLATAIKTSDRIKTFVPVGGISKERYSNGVGCLLADHPEITVLTAYDLKPYVKKYG